MNDALKLGHSDLFPLLNPVVELRSHASAGVSERADLVVESGLVGRSSVVGSARARISDEQLGEEFRIH